MELNLLRSLRNQRAGIFPVALLTGLAAACSGSGPQQDSMGEPTPAIPPATAGESTPSPAQTMPVDEPAPPAEGSGASAGSQGGSTSSLIAPTAPQTYTVKQGDTLWDIASVFLRDPWYWPEIWYVNPQVENPHLIYPGDVLALAYGADGGAQVRLERGAATRLSPRMRSQPLEGAVTAIPYEIVAAFMSKPSVIERDQRKNSPYIVSSRDQHLVAAAGNTVYAKGDLAGDVASRYNIVHVGEELRDPDDGDVLGYQGIYTGAARMTRTGDPATLELTESARETMNGDLVFPGDVDVPLDFIPHAPSTEVDGQIMSIVNGITMVGQFQVVVINRGKNHGLEPGHVLVVEQAGPTVRDRHAGGVARVSSQFAPKVRLPDERSGTFMVFKTFDRLSYGLIMESSGPMRIGDHVSSP
jgi:LysM repeat protein